MYRPLFKSYGKNFVFDPYGIYTFQRITVGNDVYLGPGAKLICAETTITLGNKIMFGPNVSILAGDHNITEIGQYMYDTKIKLPENDLPVKIEDDVWIGANAIIMKGVTIATGSIIASGAIVTKDIPPYSIAVGIPAVVRKKRFSEPQLLEHKRKILLQQNTINEV